MDYAKPRPRISPDNQPFWDGCRRHELLLPFCGACDKPHLPPGPVCPFCFGDRLDWRRAAGSGVVTSWTVVHQPWFPAFKEELPYNVVQVELAEGPRLTANLVGAPNDALRVGLPVEILFDDVAADLTLPRFRPLPLPFVSLSPPGRGSG
jgi:uncharacterized OB-fold protein